MRVFRQLIKLGRCSAFAGYILASVGQANADCLRLTSSFPHVDHLIIPSVIEAMAQRGLCMEVTHTPGPRATLLLTSGKSDGELFRVAKYGTVVGEDAVMVPSAVLEGFGLIVAKEISAVTPDQIKHGTIATLRGTHWQEGLLPPATKTFQVEDYDAGLTMLDTGRVSALLIDTISFGKIADDPKKYAFRRVTPKMSAYIFLHARHAHLLSKVDAAIRSWKQDFYSNLNGF